jgi:uncharacterized DUF497 family protein
MYTIDVYSLVALLSEFVQQIEGFQWDEANSAKNWTRHQVSHTEAEQVFLNRPVVVTEARPGAEARWFAFGRTDANRLLTVVFTIRGPLLRAISARPMSRLERKRYDQATSS